MAQDFEKYIANVLDSDNDHKIVSTRQIHQRLPQQAPHDYALQKPFHELPRDVQLLFHAHGYVDGLEYSIPFSYPCKLINHGESLHIVQEIHSKDEIPGNDMSPKLNCIPPTKMRIATEKLAGRVIEDDDQYLNVRYEDPEWPSWWCEVSINKANLLQSYITGSNLRPTIIKATHLDKTENDHETATTVTFMNADPKQTPTFHVDFVMIVDQRQSH